MHRRPVRRATLRSTAGAAVLLLATACGGDDTDPSGEPSTSPSADPAGSTSATPTTEPTPAVAADRTPSAAPATGAVLDHSVVRLRLPDGWKVKPGGTDIGTAAYGPGSAFELIIVSSIGMSRETPVEELQRIAAQNTAMERVEELPSVAVDGVEMYHLAGDGGPFRREEFGTWHDGESLVISIDLPVDTPAAERAATIDSILASVDWT